MQRLKLADDLRRTRADISQDLAAAIDRMEGA